MPGGLMSTMIGCSHCVDADTSLLVLTDEGDSPMGKTVQDIIPAYLRERAMTGDYGHETTRCARSTLYKFSDFVGQRRLGNIGENQVKKWLMSMEHLAPATRRQRLSTVRTLFHWAVRRGYCKRNPVTFVRGPKQPRTIPRALPREHIGQLLEACPDTRARLIIVLMAQQGLRCVEVSRLTLGDVDFNANTMRVLGKGGHERVLPIMSETADALRDYLAEWPSSAGALIRSYQFCQRALTAATISNLVARWMRDAGIKHKARDGVSAHANRHSCATHMLLEGAHLRDVQQALGHAHLTTTERYLPYVVKGLGEAMGGRRYGA